MSSSFTDANGKPYPKHLKEVIGIIPGFCYDNPTWKGLWYVFRDLLMYVTAVAVLLSTDNIFYLIPLWLVAGLVVSALFVIGHDAGHKALFKKKWMCDWVGRITMLPSMHVYSAWLLGHNRVHHGFTVHQERDFVWHPYTTEEYESFSPMKKFIHKLEWSSIGAGIYYLIEVWWKKMIAFPAPKKLVADFRNDRLFVLGGVLAGIAALALFAVLGKGLTGMAAAGYTAWLVVKVMVIPWLLFNYVIGAVVYLHHINPELKWHEHEAWTKFRAQMEGTMIFRVSPRILNIFLHDIMIHVPHHVDARIPFYNLDKAAKYIHDQYPGVVRDVPLRIRDYMKATRKCKLYDFHTETWMDYKGNLATESAAS